MIRDLFDEEPTAFLVIEGEAGPGKTTLWNAGIAEARERGYRVLACAAAGSEAQLSFTALRDLLADVFDDVADKLPAPQRRALGEAVEGSADGSKEER